MKFIKRSRELLLFAAFALPSVLHADDTQKDTTAYPARMNWWLQARYGMFIHWNMSSIAGTEISWSHKGTKPLDIPGDPAGYVEDPVYDNLYKKFNPTNFNAWE